MAPLPGTDASAELQPKQETWLAALPDAKSDTEAARVAGYQVPRDAAYANRRSELVRRECNKRFEEAAALLASDPDCDATTNPRLVAFVTLLRRAGGSYRSVALAAQSEVTDERGKVRLHKTLEIVQDRDNLAEIKAAEIILRLMQLDGPAVRNSVSVNVDARKQMANVTVVGATSLPPDALMMDQDSLRAEIRRRNALIKGGRGAELAASEASVHGAAIDGEFREE